MPAIITIENATSTPINTLNVGAISGGTYQQVRLNATNTGTTQASGVLVANTRITTNDGIDYVTLAPDVSGNPGTFSTATLTLSGISGAGLINSGESVWFWIQVFVPTGASPQGNPRQFNIDVSYSGT